MNVVYISPHFPPNYFLFCTHLNRLGVNVLGIADQSYDQLKPELRENLTEYYRVDALKDYDQLLKACGFFIHNYGKLDRVESHNDYWQEFEARLRTDFNIPGPKIHQIGRITRKSEMKNGFRKAGVAVARGKVIKSPEKARDLVKIWGYPVVLKPDRGVGAADTFLIRNDEERENFLARRFQVKYIMEEYIQGDLVSFDGLTDRHGNIVFHTAHVFSQGIMETVNEDRDLFYYSLRALPEDLEQAGRRTVRAFRIKEKFFHIEFFRTPRGELVGLEVNVRPPGGMTMDMFNYANNIDMYREWANVVVHNRFSAAYSRPYHCGYIGRKLNKNYAHSHRDIMQTFGRLIVHCGPVDSIFSAAIGNYAYIANSQDPDELRSVAGFIQETS